MQRKPSNNTKFFSSVEIDQFLLKLIEKYEGPRTAKTVLMKKNKMRRFILPDIKTVIKLKELIIRKLAAYTKNEHMHTL